MLKLQAALAHIESILDDPHGLLDRERDHGSGGAEETEEDELDTPGIPQINGAK